MLSKFHNYFILILDCLVYHILIDTRCCVWGNVGGVRMQYTKTEKTFYGTSKKTITAVRLPGRYVDPQTIQAFAKCFLSVGILTIATLLSILLLS